MIQLSQDQLDTLRSYKVTVDDDNINYKEVIKKTLINDPLIIYLLNNKELEDSEADPSDYLGVNILPFYMIHPTQHNVSNFICYETSFEEIPRYNDVLKYQKIYFYVLCEEKNNIEKMTGIARHDLIAARIRELFNWSNKFGLQCKIKSNIPSITDNDYATRTLVFELTTPKNLVKTKDGVTRTVNNIEVN